MANWRHLKISQAIEDIETKKLLLPNIQRDFVWGEEKIIALFQTLCIGDSYGGIMTVLDEKGTSRKPMFDVRYFVPDYVDGQRYSSLPTDFNHAIEYVIDGQQRLSSIFIGVKGSYNGKRLYFDLFGDYKNNEYNFAFSKDGNSLPNHLKDDESDLERPCWWMSIPELYNRFVQTPDPSDLEELLLDERDDSISDIVLLDRVRRNLVKLSTALRGDDSVGICQVHCVLKQKDKNQEDCLARNRMRIVNLFRKLNQGGTVLSGLELMRSMLKALASENEEFLYVIKDKYADIGLDQDGIIKFIFLLQDQVSKEITDVTKKDSDFITSNQDRIYASLDALGRYLDRFKLTEYVKKYRPSTIPLYLLAYYLYHLPNDNASLVEYFEGDIHSNNVRKINRWMRASLLNRTFQRGRGWNPDRTGRKLIHAILAAKKGVDFPIEEIFSLYSIRLHWFDPEPKDDEARINNYDRAYIYYALYQSDILTRKNDADHIIAKDLLEKAGLTDRFYTISNFQLLYFRENRSKQDEIFRDWVHKVFNDDPKKIDDFTTTHCIPKDESLWVPERFEDFCNARRALIVAKLKSLV